MFEDIEPDLVFQSDEAFDDHFIEAPEIDIIPPTVERLWNWLDTVDK
jgi:hypothetical protein